MKGRGLLAICIFNYLGANEIIFCRVTILIVKIIKFVGGNLLHFYRILKLSCFTEEETKERLEPSTVFFNF